jgi:hypothetical protein
MLGEKGAVMTTLDDVAKKKAAEQPAEQRLRSRWFGWPRSIVCR